MSDVRTFPGVTPPEEYSQPHQPLIETLEKALAMAKSGQLQSFIGAGFTCDGLRFSAWCDRNPNTYEMLGSIRWLEAEYIHRHTEALK